MSLGAFVWSIAFPITSFALPAWAAQVAGVLSAFAPLSWVVAGFLGLLCYALCVAIYGYGQERIVRSKYDAKLLANSGPIDPLAKVFEARRIFLNDFVLPSNPIIEGKRFVDCEIVGPSNLFMQGDYSINNVRAGRVDAVCLTPQRPFDNGYIFRNCVFRGCTFHRITFFMLPYEAIRHAHLDWLNWITDLPDDPQGPQQTATLIEDQSDQSPTETAKETPH